MHLGIPSAEPETIYLPDPSRAYCTYLKFWIHILICLWTKQNSAVDCIISSYTFRWQHAWRICIHKMKWHKLICECLFNVLPIGFIKKSHSLGRTCQFQSWYPTVSVFIPHCLGLVLVSNLSLAYNTVITSQSYYWVHTSIMKNYHVRTQ